MKKRQGGFSIVETLLVLICVALIGLISWYIIHVHNAAHTKPRASTTTIHQKISRGTVNGTPTYPSESLPADEQVCAASTTDTGKVYCENIGQKQTIPTCSPVADINCPLPKIVDFSLSVPTGTYYVYATANKEMPNYKAYDDAYVTCGNQANCPSSGHQQKTIITVVPDKPVSANPGDWYAQ